MPFLKLLCYAWHTDMYFVLCDPLDYNTLRLPCPSPTPRACSNLCPLNWSIAIQPSHPLSPLLLLLSISQHQGTLHTLIATCFLWQRYYTCFSCEDSGPKRLRFGAWLHSFRRTQRGLERPLKKGLQFSIKSGIDHKLSSAFPTSLYGLRCARPMMNPLSDAHRGNLLSTE